MMDALLEEFQIRLKEALTWLDYACGRVTEHNERGRKLPKIYIGGGDYQNVMPDDRLGNYCFFDIDPDSDFSEWNKNRGYLLRSTFGLVFWFNLETIYPDSLASEVETVKAEVLDALTAMNLRRGSFTIDQVSDNAEGVFRRYGAKGYQEKYMLHPYGALRFSGQLILRNPDMPILITETE